MENRTTNILNTEADIRTVCAELAEMLVGKNRAYGDSALSPIRVFSKADALEQLKVRLDDKLSRLMNMQRGADAMGEDPEWDLMGYLVLIKIARMRIKRELELKGKLNNVPGVALAEAGPNYDTAEEAYPVKAEEQPVAELPEGTLNRDESGRVKFKKKA